MIDFDRLAAADLNTDPFRWAEVGSLFSPVDADSLARTYPHDRFKILKGDDGEKSYEYWARSLIGMSVDRAAFEPGLSDAWRALAGDLLSPDYRTAMTRLTGVELGAAPLEVNVFHYGPGAWLGPHLDLAEKIVTHVLYFNETWDPADGGCLTILRSKDPSGIVTRVLPEVGNSAVLVRSDASWHAVEPVTPSSRASRRSMTVTFYSEGATSSMWPTVEEHELRDYHGEAMGAAAEPVRGGPLRRLRRG